MWRMRSVAILIALSLNPAVTQAADWWSINDGVDEQNLSVDLSSLRCQQETCTVKERTTYSVAQKDGASSVIDGVEYNCPEAQSRTLSEERLARSGRTIRTSVNIQPPRILLLPGSLEYVALNFACRGLAMDQQNLRSGLASFAGGRFRRLPSLETDPAPPQSAPRMKPAPEASRSSTWTVQVLSVPSQQAAGSMIRKLADIPRPISVIARVEKTALRGRPLYRATFINFTTLDQAQHFCIDVKATNSDCFTRRNAHAMGLN